MVGRIIVRSKNMANNLGNNLIRIFVCAVADITVGRALKGPDGGGRFLVVANFSSQRADFMTE